MHGTGLKENKAGYTDNQVACEWAEEVIKRLLKDFSWSRSTKNCLSKNGTSQRMDRQTYRWMDGWTDGWTDRQTDGQNKLVVEAISTRLDKEKSKLKNSCFQNSLRPCNL